MKTLDTEFTHKGWEHRQIDRRGDVALFERGKPSQRVHWEVVRLRKARGFKVAGREIPEREVYPASEAWGTDGFTVADLETAKRKMTSLLRVG